MDYGTETDSEEDSDRDVINHRMPNQRSLVPPIDLEVSSDEEHPIPSIEREDDDYGDIEEDQNDDDDAEGRMAELPPPLPTIKVEDMDALLMPPPPNVMVGDMGSEISDLARDLLRPPGPDEVGMAWLRPPREADEEIMAELPPLPEHNDEDMPDLPPPPGHNDEDVADLPPPQEHNDEDMLDLSPPPEAQEEAAPDSGNSSPLSSVSSMSTPPWMKDAL